MAFLWPLVIAEGGLLGLDTRILGRAMQLEFLVVISGGAPSNADGWGRNAEILPAGVVYFTILGAIELSGVFGLLRRVNWREWRS